MFHHVARARRGLLLFHTWSQGLELWRLVLRACPSPVALFLMPDHLHLLARGDVRRRLGIALQAYAQIQNRARGRSGRLFDPTPDPTEPIGRLKEARDERYIHLQACRARLATDPLAWPLSTYRDALDLVAAPVRPVDPDPERFHRFTSSDPTVHPAGTELPGWRLGRLRGPEAIRTLGFAVSAVTRTPVERLWQRGPARTLWIEACCVLGTAEVDQIARELEVDERTVQRARAARPSRHVELVGRVAGDPRFPGLLGGDLRLRQEWGRYRARTEWQQEVD